ncbi:MAG: ribonuclease P protein subunit [Thermoplasmata archaeon]|jgi:RNase P/RNase MRP subunit p29
MVGEGESSWAERSALAGEILGAAISVHQAPGIRPLPLRGTVVDESMHTFTVRLAGRGRLVCLPKGGLRGTILLGERELPLIGDNLRVRPQDRTKRILAGGSRRIR